MTVMPANIGMDLAVAEAVPANAFAHRVVEILRTACLSLAGEYDLQCAAAKILDRARLTYKRDVKVSGGRIDFMVGSVGRGAEPTPMVGIEVTVRGGKGALLRHFSAVCGDLRIGHLIVVTARPLDLPTTLRGKEVTVIQVGRAYP